VANTSGKKHACTVLYCTFRALRYVKTLVTTTPTNAQFYNYVFLPFLSYYVFRHSHYPQAAYTKISLKPTVKDKAIPLQVWTGPEGSRRLRIPDFKTVGT